jgi:ribonucleotide reductase alpha subunit
MKTKRVQLKDLKIGDKIKTFNGLDDIFEEVTDKFTSVVLHQNQMLLTFSNGSSLECSNNHPIMCYGENRTIVEVHAEHLTSAHEVIAENLEVVNLVNVIRGRVNDENYVDITVGHTHTFYAANAHDSNMVLTHNSQGGVRDGSSTINVPIWHQEILDIAVLKNNKGTDDNRVKNLDYLIQMSKLFINRMLKNEQISLFSTSEAPELYKVWGQPGFDEAYIAYEADETVSKKTVQGTELLQTIITERINTGRIYYMFIDNVNSTSQFDEPITMTNLCFSGDTVVAVADGRNGVTIEQLAKESNGVLKFPVYSATNRTNVNAKKKWKTEIKNAVAFHSGKKKVVEITLTNGSKFKCTEDHELATNVAKVYVKAKDSVGMQLESFVSNADIKAKHQNVYVESIQYLDEEIDVYDLTVEDNHNFYIITSTDDSKYLNCQGILVHNCTEITQPTTPIYDVNSEDGEISLCNLGGLNLGFIKGPNTFYKLEEPIYRLVKAVDTIIDIQDYPVPAARKQLLRRNMGIGVSNFAYWLAKNGVKYTDEASLPLVDELFEHIQYYLIKASVRLAQERGRAPWFHKTKYAQGIMPFDNVVQGAKDLVDRPLTLDWEALRAMVLQYGMRNSVLSAQMPVESSSIPQNSTNGIEPPRALRSVKTNKTGGAIVMLMPEADKLANQYTLAWDITSNSPINKITSVIQKWIDQAISVNHYYNPLMQENRMIPAKQVIQDMVEFYKLGGKCMYYANTLDSIEEQESGCGEGGCTL